MIPNGIKSELYIDHIVLTVSNIERTRDFYIKIFGDHVHYDEHSIMYYVGETKLFLVLPCGTLPKDDKFDSNRIGLDHFAFGVRTLDNLKE
ncbi:MAG: VOC family protein, partial [Bacteroidia bacterium]|nr:VOC family protein [Bacteroidia bacterium]